MADPDLLLDVAVSGIVPASGIVAVRLGPTSTRVQWHVTNASVQVSSNVLEPTANLYLNSKATKLAGTYAGSNDSSPLDVWVRNGVIICEWTGADVGARATLFLQGTMKIGF